jgi:hypothetical protein
MSPSIVATRANKKSPLLPFSSTSAAISPPPPSCSQIEAAEQSVQLALVQFDALLVLGNAWQLKGSRLQAFVPNAEAILIPEQDLDPIAITIEEEEQMARQRILDENLFRLAHQAVEAIAHLGRRQAEKDAGVSQVVHEFGDLQGRSPPTMRMTSTKAAWPTLKGSRTTPPLGNWSSIGDALRETGKNVAGFDSACCRAASSATRDSGMPSLS